MAEYAIIGEFNTLQDWNARLVSVEIGLPKVKSHFIELPLESTVLDLSETVMGYPAYGTREIALYLGKKDNSPKAWASSVADIAKAIHGKRLLIRLSFDPNYYFMGRISCETEKIDFRRSTYKITAICDPFRYSVDATSQSISVSGTRSITLQNKEMIVSPTFTTSAQGMTVSCNGEETWSIRAGSDVEIPEILLLPGTNTMTFKGNGTVGIKYREGVI